MVRRPNTMASSRIFLCVCATLAAFASLLAGPASGDFVVKRDGKRLSGLIRDESPQVVVLETTDGILVTLDRKQITRIEKEASVENLVFTARLHLRKPKPDFLRAADQLSEALQAGADPALIRQTIIEVGPYFLPRFSYMVAAERKKWNALCDQLTRHAPEDQDWAFFRGEMAVAMNEPRLAAQAWRPLDSTYFATHPADRSRVTAWALRQMNQALTERRFDDSVAALELLNVADPQRARSGRVILMLRSAADARDRGEIGEACRIYAEELLPASPEIAKVYLRTTLDPYCESLKDAAQFPEAIRILRAYALPHLPELATGRLKTIYGRWYEGAVAKARWDEARTVLAEGGAFFDEGEIERYNQLGAFAERRAQLAEKDYLGHYQLAVEMKDHQLFSPAVEEFYLAARSPQLKDLAEQQIERIREEEQLALLKTMLARFQEEKYLEVLDLVEEFRKAHANSKHMARVNDLSKRAHEAATRATQTAVELGASTIQNAQRLYLLGQTDEALALLQIVIRDHPEVPAAREARKLRENILKERAALGIAPRRGVTENRASTETAAAESLLPHIDPALLNQLHEDTFKQEIEEILKQLEL